MKILEHKIIKILYLSLFGFLVCITIVKADLKDGLVADYPFNGNANDATGNGNDGIVNGAQLSTDRFGEKNSAFTFDGIKDFISIGNNVKPPMPLTVNLWFNANTIRGSMPLFRNDRVDGGSSRNGVFLSMFDNGLSTQFFSGFSVQSTRKGVFTTNTVVVAGEWTMMTVVFENINNFRIYVNGSEQDVVPNTGTGNSMTYSNADGAIGSVNDTANNASVFSSNFFDGSIDDVKIYNRALSNTEITQLFQSEIDSINCDATFQESLLHIPCVDVNVLDPFGSTATVKYKADLDYQLNSSPVTFVLSEAQQIDKIPVDVEDCVAIFKTDGTLNIPCVSVTDAFGGIVIYEADLELIPFSSPSAFKLIKAQKKNN